MAVGDLAAAEAEEAAAVGNSTLMKNRSKIGKRPGNPAFRTPSVFRYHKDLTIIRNKSRINRMSIDGKKISTNQNGAN